MHSLMVMIINGIISPLGKVNQYHRGVSFTHAFAFHFFLLIIFPFIIPLFRQEYSFSHHFAISMIIIVIVFFHKSCAKKYFQYLPHLLLISIGCGIPYMER